MSRFAPAVLAALLVVACRHEPVTEDAAIFPALSGRVVDEANLLTPADEQMLTADSAAVERETGAQFVVVTVPSLHGQPIEDYGVKLGRTWGIGRKGVNDGLLLIVAPNERKVRIEVGTGLEKRVTDPFAAQVIREDALPRFSAGQFSPGIRAASASLIRRLRSKASDSQIAAEDQLVQ